MNAFRVLSTGGWALALMICFAGCASVPKFKTEVDPKLDPQNYTTFYMIPLPTNHKVIHREPELVKELAPLAIAAVQNVMTEKGFVAVETAAAADLVIVVHGGLTPKSVVLIDQNFSPGVPRPGASVGSIYDSNRPGVVHRRDYEEGLLVVEAHDSSSNHIVWVSWLKRDVLGSEVLDAEFIASNIEKLLRKFPGRD